MLFLLLACTSPCADGYGRDDAGRCVPLATGEGEGPGEPGADDTGADSDPGDTGPPYDTDSDTAEPPDPIAPGAALGLEVGHPIELLSEVASVGRGFEFVDAVMLDDTYAALAGQGGVAVVRVEDGQIREELWTDRSYRIALDASTSTLWLATRAYGVMPLDVSEPTELTDGALHVISDSWHEDIAADGGLALVAAQEEGGILLDADAQRLGVLAADYAFGAGLVGDRAVLTDGAEVSLWDVSDPARPAVLDRAALAGTGRDVAFDGARIAVATGGDGVEVLDVQGDALVYRGAMDVGGASFGVALDGDWLWIAAWSHVALAWVGEGDPVVLGHHPVEEFVTGVGARDGRAAITRWESASTLAAVPGVGGAELEIASAIWFPDDGAQSLTVRNGGAFDLSLSLTAPTDYAIAPDALALAPGDAEAILITPAAGADDAELSWTSDDPDEPSGAVALKASSQNVGAQHLDFSLQGFVWPDSELRPISLSDYAGQVVVLIYFTTW